MPALAGSLFYITGAFDVKIRFGLVVLAIATMYYDLLPDPNMMEAI